MLPQARRRALRLRSRSDLSPAERFSSRDSEIEPADAVTDARPSPLRRGARNRPMAPLAGHKLIKPARRCADGCQCGVLHLPSVSCEPPRSSRPSGLNSGYGSFHNSQGSQGESDASAPRRNAASNPSAFRFATRGFHTRASSRAALMTHSACTRRVLVY